MRETHLLALLANLLFVCAFSTPPDFVANRVFYGNHKRESDSSDLVHLIEHFNFSGEWLSDGSIINLLGILIDMDRKNAIETTNFIFENLSTLPQILERIENKQKKFRITWHLQDIFHVYMGLDRNQKIELSKLTANTGPAENFFKVMSTFQDPQHNLDLFFDLLKKFKGAERRQKLENLLKNWKLIKNQSEHEVQYLFKNLSRLECLSALKKRSDQVELMNTTVQIMDSVLNLTKSCLFNHNITLYYEPDISELQEFWKQIPILQDGSFASLLNFFELFRQFADETITHTKNLVHSFQSLEPIQASINGVFDEIERCTPYGFEVEQVLRALSSFNSEDLQYLHGHVSKFLELPRFKQHLFVDNTFGYEPDQLGMFFTKLNGMVYTDYFISVLKDLPGMNREKDSMDMIHRIHLIWKFWNKLSMDHKTNVKEFFGKEKPPPRQVECEKLLSYWNNGSSDSPNGLVAVVDLIESFGITPCKEHLKTTTTIAPGRKTPKSG